MAYSITIHTVPSRNRGIASAVIMAGCRWVSSWVSPWRDRCITPWGAGGCPFWFWPSDVSDGVLFQGAIREVQIAGRRTTPVWDLLCDPVLLRMNLSGFCVLYGWWVLLSWGPVFFQSERNVGLTMSGLYTLVIAVTAIPSGLLLGRVSDHIGRKTDHPGDAPAHGAQPGGYPTGAVRTGMLLALMAYGSWESWRGTHLAISWLGDYVARHRPEAVGAAVSLFSFLSVMSAVVGPPLTGWIRTSPGHWRRFLCRRGVGVGGVCPFAGPRR